MKPATRRAIGNAFIRGRNVPLPEERLDLIVKGIGAVGLEDDSSIGIPFDRRFGDLLSPVFDITLALPSGFGAAGAIWDLKIALGGQSSFSSLDLRIFGWDWMGWEEKSKKELQLGLDCLRALSVFCKWCSLWNYRGFQPCWVGALGLALLIVDTKSKDD